MTFKEETAEKKFTKKINDLYIDPIIFTYKFACQCTGECCHYGVYTDKKEHDQILRIEDKILPLFDETQIKDKLKWFEPPEEDEDFESGIAVGTEVINGKCSFLDGEGLCVLQKLAMLESEHKWKYKPIYCVLFPLTTFEGALTIDDEHLERLKTCNKIPDNEKTIFESCEEELRYFFGEEGFKELDEYRTKYLKETQFGKDGNSNK
jgi:Fe-S-cluster containining protein